MAESALKEGQKARRRSGQRAGFASRRAGPATKLFEAIRFAIERHAGQLRRDGRTPYVVHPLRVCLRLALEGKVTDQEVLSAAVLHDLIEDTPTDYEDIEERFGKRVADMVAALSKDMRLPKPERTRAYLDVLSRQPAEVLLIKLFDVYDNLSDVETLPARERQQILEEKEKELPELLASAPRRYGRIARDVLSLLRRAKRV